MAMNTNFLFFVFLFFFSFFAVDNVLSHAWYVGRLPRFIPKCMYMHYCDLPAIQGMSFSAFISVHI